MQALLSRCQVVPLKLLSVADLLAILRRALASDVFLQRSGVGSVVSLHHRSLLATKADGDARMALNMLDACAATVASRADKWRFFPVVS